MILPTIDGRECVPVRLLPFMTCWRPLSPDVVARLLSRRDEWHQWSISSFNLSPNGQHDELQPRAWNTIDDDLTVLSRNLKAQEDFEFQKYPQWRHDSLALLPAAVFVWRDELVAEYARSFGLQKYPSIRPGAVEISEEEAAAECESIIRLCSNPDTSAQADAAIEKGKQSVARDTVYLPGDGELSFTPLLSADEERVVFEGFESVLAGSLALAHPQQTEQGRVILGASAMPELLPTASSSVLVGVSTSKVESPDKGPTLKKAALVRKCLPKWPTIRSDLHSASENGLSAAAKAPAHGEWFEGPALDWARKKGKLSENNQTAPVANSAFNISGQVHRIER